jgi:hypothetical protein
MNPTVASSGSAAAANKPKSLFRSKIEYKK